MERQESIDDEDALVIALKDGGEGAEEAIGVYNTFYIQLVHS